MSIGHCSNGVLDFQVQSFSEFYYGGFGVCVPHFCYQLYKFTSTDLGFDSTSWTQFVDCCNIGVGWKKVLLELFPV